MNKFNLLVEAIVVGLIFLILGIFAKKLKLNEPMTLFVAGAAGHLLFEVSGANKWYCANGNACKLI
tara:strand:+ start:1888 stop:2085 length:198 start_codon:yes stop_codon:yes gene_type:complete